MSGRSSRLIEVFEEETLVEKIRRRLPYLFQTVELRVFSNVLFLM